MLAVLKTAMEHKNGSLVDVFFSAELSQAISPGLTDLVRECLWVNPLRRASIRELLNHPYFRKIRVSHVIGKKWKLQPTLDFLEALDDSVQRNGKIYMTIVFPVETCLTLMAISALAAYQTY